MFRQGDLVRFGGASYTVAYSMCYGTFTDVRIESVYQPGYFRTVSMGYLTPSHNDAPNQPE